MPYTLLVWLCAHLLRAASLETKSRRKRVNYKTNEVSRRPRKMLSLAQPSKLFSLVLFQSFQGHVQTQIIFFTTASLRHSDAVQRYSKHLLFRPSPNSRKLAFLSVFNGKYRSLGGGGGGPNLAGGPKP